MNATVKKILKYYEERMENCMLERKNCGYAFHYRNCNQPGVQVAIKKMFKDLSKIKDLYGFRISKGKETIEIKKATKSDVVLSGNYSLIAGDDFTDEEMFFVAPSDCITIKIGREPSRAKYFVNNPSDFLKKLEMIMQL